MTARAADSEPADAPGADAAQADAAAEESPRQRFLLVSAADALYGIPVGSVREILRTPAITRVPYTADVVAGVVAVRGEIMAVLDFGLALAGVAAERPGRLVVVDSHRDEEPVALLVDGVSGIEDLGIESDVPPEVETRLPQGSGGWDQRGRTGARDHASPLAAGARYRPNRRRGALMSGWEKRFLDWRVRDKILFGYGIILVFMALVVLIAWWQTAAIRDFERREPARSCGSGRKPGDRAGAGRPHRGLPGFHAHRAGHGARRTRGRAAAAGPLPRRGRYSGGRGYDAEPAAGSRSPNSPAAGGWKRRTRASTSAWLLALMMPPALGRC